MSGTLDPTPVLSIHVVREGGAVIGSGKVDRTHPERIHRVALAEALSVLLGIMRRDGITLSDVLDSDERMYVARSLAATRE